MYLPIPDFVPVFSAETIRLVSITLLIVGVCAVTSGAILLFLNKRKGTEKNTPACILICVGVLLTVNHGLQLIL